MIRKWLHKFYVIYVLATFVGLMLILLPLLTLPFLFGDKYGGRVAYFFLGVWSFFFSLLVGVRYRTYGREHLQKGQPYIFTSNHNSFMDVVMSVREVPGQFRPLAKSDLRNTPIFGWIYRGATVMVDRTSAESRRKSLKELKAVLTKGISVFVFPEGRMNRTSSLLTPFYDGAFRIAIETQTPIAPIVILNTGYIMPYFNKDFHPGVITTYFLPPIETRNMTLADVPDLKMQVYNQMLAVLEGNVSSHNKVV
ncbi:1-acyl-sn-glycerol-3-phosphate acyltransferase [Catalinimonas alkaloidigena]|uniref:1-acyl-sn-glycerol-3-phosphate acyltransferase n=1 Tax=Catalinimonas alkaloidigena TaxID=1075417 RepID=A0A1G9GP19_9BACT|nr:lysophospholipid acyltransferase family protein [Catalinimonas alkaloidigena]SDL02362.1 1-acyl-sn-glycerol-3-phosphate acyltransferase [Catalinimonas alkaloidigena]